MYYYSIEQLEELKKYNAIFPNNKKIQIILRLADKQLGNNKNILIQKLSTESNIPISTIYSWIRRYQTEGITSLYSETEVIDVFLKSSTKLHSEWNKRSLCQYLKINKLTIQGVDFHITPSETLCWNALNASLKDNSIIGQNVSLNEWYQDKEKKGYTFVLVDYIKVPNTKYIFTAYSRYMFIILKTDDIKLKRIKIDRTKVDKKDNETVIAIQKMFGALAKDDDLKKNSFVILSNEEVNCKAREIYMIKKQSFDVVTYNMSKADGKLKKRYQILNQIKHKMEENISIVDSKTALKNFINEYLNIIYNTD